MTYIVDTDQVEQISASKDTETIFCKIQRKDKKKLTIGCMYRPPDYNLEQSRQIVKEIYSVK